ncbi:hypothetical protein [Lacrimispora sp.]|uniref:hypothetical protein n=1 Tax=Lacrimispora sp. TaxID=2719234 RepID=UPI0028B1B4D7|nr:hypothetical protein [Lacrimispora sp.]
MDITYFQKINNAYKSFNKQETDLYLLNKHVDDHFADTIDYHVVTRNGQPYELIIIRDAEGNTFKKKIKTKHSTPFNLGDYIEWNNQYWLVTLIDPDEKAYHSGYMYLCTVPLRWQNSKGEIVQRWAFSEDFTKYSSGISANNTITIGDNQYGLTIPIDEETKQLKRDMRFSIDLDDAKEPDIYKLTNRKVNLNNYQYFGRGSNMSLTLTFDAYNKDLDKRIMLDDGTEAWIAGYISSSTLPLNPDPDETANLFAHINYTGSNIIRIGGNKKKFTASLTDKSGDYLDMTPIWAIETEGLVEMVIVDNELQISCDDKNMDQSTLVISVKDEHSGFSTSINVLISAF